MKFCFPQMWQVTLSFACFVSVLRDLCHIQNDVTEFQAWHNYCFKLKTVEQDSRITIIITSFLLHHVCIYTHNNIISHITVNIVLKRLLDEIATVFNLMDSASSVCKHNIYHFSKVKVELFLATVWMWHCFSECYYPPAKQSRQTYSGVKPGLIWCKFRVFWYHQQKSSMEALGKFISECVIPGSNQSTETLLSKMFFLFVFGVSVECPMDWLILTWQPFSVVFFHF